MLPHPEHEMAARVDALRERGRPDVMIWTPLSSRSGAWEAEGDGWIIAEESPAVFCDKLEERLGRP